MNVVTEVVVDHDKHADVGHAADVDEVSDCVAPEASAKHEVEQTLQES